MGMPPMMMPPRPGTFMFDIHIMVLTGYLMVTLPCGAVMPMPPGFSFPPGAAPPNMPLPGASAAGAAPAAGAPSGSAQLVGPDFKPLTGPAAVVNGNGAAAPGAAAGSTTTAGTTAAAPAPGAQVMVWTDENYSPEELRARHERYR
jgi:hypothetical protein